jgi:Ankyrin repeats (3 copies)/Ankyrin repeat
LFPNERIDRLLTLKSTALKPELSDFASSGSTLVPNDVAGIPFDSDAGTALIHFAETASISKYSVSVADGPDATDHKQPILHRNNSALTKLLIQSVEEGSISDTRDALKVVHVDSQDPDGRTALSFAAELGRLEIAELLIDRHASVSIRQYTNKHRTDQRPHIGMYGGRAPLHWAAEHGRPNIIRLLLRNGANPNARTIGGRTPMQEAAMHNRIEVMKILLEYGADVNCRTYIHV